MTHVLNTAEGQTSGTVDTNQVFSFTIPLLRISITLHNLQKFYKPFNIKYKGLKLLDVSQANISIHFTEISDFIDEALQGGGKILVNCQKGVSRSSAAVLAYLMLRHDMTAVEALVEVNIKSVNFNFFTLTRCRKRKHFELTVQVFQMCIFYRGIWWVSILQNLCFPQIYSIN